MSDPVPEEAQAMLARAKASFSAQPFSLLLGAELTVFSNAGTEIRLRVRDELRQQYGYVHGGVIRRCDLLRLGSGSPTVELDSERSQAVRVLRPEHHHRHGFVTQPRIDLQCASYGRNSDLTVEDGEAGPDIDGEDTYRAVTAVDA